MKMKKTINYKGCILHVDLDTLDVRAENSTYEYEIFNKYLNRWFISWTDISTWKQYFVPRARLICLAAHPRDDFENFQCGHLNDDPTDDRPENLCWMTRKDNNSTEHSKMMRRLHAKCTNHSMEVVRAVNKKTGEVKYFANGRQCAQAIHCSHVAAYKCLNPEHYGYSVKGWCLTWEPVSAQTASVKLLQHEAYSSARKLAWKSKKEKEA